MAKESDALSAEQQKPEPERMYNREQYEMLKRCSDKKKIREWNACTC